MNVRYRVELSQAERDKLTEMLSGGKHAARKLKRAQILLAADTGIGDASIASSVAVGEIHRLPNQAYVGRYVWVKSGTGCSCSVRCTRPTLPP